jgi:hypothetical protein
MVEVLDKLEQLAKEQDSIPWTADAQANEPEELLVIATFVSFLQRIWGVMQSRFRKGGVPAKRLLQECDLLIQLSTGMGQRLALVNKVSPAEQVQAVSVLLDSLVRDVNKVRERAATPPRTATDPEELKRRVKQADEGGEWVKLSDVVSRMRKQE